MAGSIAPPTGRAAALAPSAIPNRATSFLGRAREVAALRAALLNPARPGGTRLLTLTGTGGVGKTRLALAAVEGLAESFRDGVIVAPLAAAGNEAAALLAIAQAAGSDGAGQLDIEERVLALLRDRSCLLVLDNLEHLPAFADRVALLLAACPELSVLATSRTPLRLPGEAVVRVEPLSLPSDEPISAPVALAAPAVALFVDRVGAVDPGFALTDATAPIVAEICRRLDGLPLAIELAAAACRALGPADVLERLGRRLPLPPSRDRQAPERHQTLRAAIAWSYDLLAPADQALLRSLAIAPAGLCLDAIELVGRGVAPVLLDSSTLPASGHAHRLLDSVTELVESSLVQRTTLADGRARYGMLETVREFALERLEAAGETDAAIDALTEWSLEFLDEIRDRFRDPARRPADEVWLAQVDLERENLRAALHAMLHRRDASRALRLASSVLVVYWGIRGLQREASEVLERALVLIDETGAEIEPHFLAKAFADAGSVRIDFGDLDEADAFVRRALAMGRALGDDRIISSQLANLGFVASQRGALNAAVSLYEESIAIRRRGGLPLHALASGLVNLGGVFVRQGERDRAAPVLAEALEAAEQSGDVRIAAFALLNLAEVAVIERRNRDALDLARQSLALFGQLQDRRGTSMALNIRGLALLDLELTAEAAATFGEALPLSVQAGDRLQLAPILDSVATLFAVAHLDAPALRLLGASEAAREQVRAGAEPSYLTGRFKVRETIRARTDAVAFNLAWNAGRARSLEDAAAEAGAHLAHLARTLGNASPKADAGRAIVHEVEGVRVRLTRRELDVLRLLADGQTDREIADGLYLSPKTVSKHVANILAEIGVATRTAAAVRAVRYGLI